MQVVSQRPDASQPETLVRHLANRLGHHVLWDSLLMFLPPLAVLAYLIAVLFRAAWLEPIAAIFSVAVLAAIGALAVRVYYRPRVPSVASVAHMIDRQTGGKDHFLTLSTIDPAHTAASFLSRLRGQTAVFVHRVELKRDFPYRPKRSVYGSLGASLIAVILIHFLAPFAESTGRQEIPDRLRQLAREMAARPTLKTVGRDLQALARKLEDPNTTAEEKRAETQQLEKKIEEQEKKEEQKDNRDLLGQAASALEGVEQQVASAQQGQKENQKGGAGIESNLPQQGQGESKQSQGGGGESKNQSGAQSDSDAQQGKPTKSNPKETGQEKNPQQGEAKENNQADPNQPNNQQSKEQAGKTQGGSKEGAGKERASNEPPPQGTQPAERFYQSGEGKEGLKGARYVTVQLPEELAADSKGESRATRDGKSNRSRTQIPVSNMPLPAHVPNAPEEKQPLPIEYRGMIR